MVVNVTYQLCISFIVRSRLIIAWLRMTTWLSILGGRPRLWGGREISLRKPWFCFPEVFMLLRRVCVRPSMVRIGYHRRSPLSFFLNCIWQEKGAQGPLAPSWNGFSSHFLAEHRGSAQGRVLQWEPVNKGKAESQDCRRSWGVQRWSRSFGGVSLLREIRETHKDVHVLRLDQSDFRLGGQ